MKKTILSLVLLLSAIGLFSENIEFLGIKTGMTKEEVKVIIDYDKLSVEGSYSNPKSTFDEDEKIVLGKELYTDNNYSNKFTAYPAASIYFSFTQDKILWKIEVYFPASSILDENYFINNNAKKLALESCFTNAEIELIDVGRYGDKQFVVVFKDDNILDEAINKKRDEFISSFKQS